MKSEDFPVEAEEIRQAIAIANRVEHGEERVFTFEEAMADLEKDHRMGAASCSAGPLMPVFDPARSERITRLRNAMQRAEVILESGTVEAMTSQEVQEEIDAWRSERSESAMASILRGWNQAKRGEFVDPPDLVEDERLAAMIPD
jgi:hypothetical protein